MDRFVSNYTHRLDSKGRVSIPATFRAVLARDGFEGLYVHPALDAPALDAGGNMLLAGIDAFLSTLPPYSDERDHLSTALFGTSEILKVDPEGRVILTESVKAHAGVGDAVTFVGLGPKFQIWEPDRFRAHLEEARAKVRDLKRSFGAQAGTGATQDIPPGARGR
jgi:MraZ protein